MEAVLRADAAVFAWFNGWVGHFPWLDAVVQLTCGDYFAPGSMSVLLLATWFFGRDAVDREHRQRGVARAMIAMAFANLAVFIVNDHYFRPRPFDNPDLVVSLLFFEPTDSSFPANPAAVAFALASGMCQGSKRMGIVFYALAVVWVVTRMYAGVFYPLDVLAGAGIGLVVSYLVRWWLWSMEPAPTFVLGMFRRLHLA